MNKPFKPIVGITMGDASGIGPEVIVKALSLKDVFKICVPIVIGDAGVMEIATKFAQDPPRINAVDGVKGIFECGTIDVLDLRNVDPSMAVVGKVNSASGKAAVEFVEKAVELALKKEIHAIVTAPLNKEAINLAGYPFQGHTEILSHLTNTRRYAMMLAAGSMRVVHVTTHVSLREACDLIDRERVLDTILLTHQALVAMGVNNPRIGVSGLNPHAGEGGLFGGEETEHITPAVQEAQEKGIEVQGPFPADTVFLKAEGDFDAVVVMYHDQGHIPVKLLGFERGVNITLGLPIIRTSVDHGTAFDIAGKGIANPGSMIEAIKTAVSLAKNRFRNL